VIVVRFVVQAQLDRVAELADALAQAVVPSRAVPGVIRFNVARDLTEPQVLIATEVFEDREAMQRQATLPEVARVVALMQGEMLAAPPEVTIYEVVSAEAPSP
jgi:quinol monooxygenase YgiN